MTDVAKEIKDQTEALKRALKIVEDKMDYLLEDSKETKSYKTESMESFDQASRQVHLALALNSLRLLGLKSLGRSVPKSHPVRSDMDRLKDYFKKLESAKSKLGTSYRLHFKFRTSTKIIIEQKPPLCKLTKKLPSESLDTTRQRRNRIRN